MSNYEENERALKELIQDVKSVPGTFPPVYTCGDVIIGYDRQGQFRVMASIKAEPVVSTEDGWFKRWQSRLTPLTPGDENQQNLIDTWIHRWQERHWKSHDPSQRQLGQV
jgi:hypothetical protein